MKNKELFSGREILIKDLPIGQVFNKTYIGSSVYYLKIDNISYKCISGYTEYCLFHNFSKCLPCKTFDASLFRML